MSAVRTLHVSNVPSDATQQELAAVFGSFGEVPRIEMKRGFAFVGFASSANARSALAADLQLAHARLRCDFARKDMDLTGAGSARPPSKVLFVVNFDRSKVSESTLRGRFSRYGEISKISTTDSFALIEFASLQSAKEALEQEHNSFFEGRQLTVQFSDKQDLSSSRPPRRDRSRSPRRSSRRSRSRSRNRRSRSKSESKGRGGKRARSKSPRRSRSRSGGRRRSRSHSGGRARARNGGSGGGGRGRGGSGGGGRSRSRSPPARKRSPEPRKRRGSSRSSD